MKKVIQQRIRVWVEGSPIRSIKELGDITFFPPPEKDKRTKEYKEWIKYVDAKIKWTATKYQRRVSRMTFHYRRFQDENESFVHFYEEHTGKKESEKEDGCFLSILLLLIPTSGLFILLLS